MNEFIKLSQYISKNHYYLQISHIIINQKQKLKSRKYDF